MKRASPAIRLGREQVLSASKLTNIEARALIANYYMAQDMRKGTDMQLRHAGDKADPVGILKFTADRYADIEADTLKALGKYAEGSKLGQWLLSQTGIGPVIVSGFLAHLDITRAPTAGHFWSFAGQNPQQKWEKGQKRPWNADLKQLVFHAGECIKRVSNHPDSFYGKFYRERKALLEKRNEAGEFAERAKTFVAKSADWKKVLATGKLPAGNLDRQACNITVKILLSHLHALMYWDTYNKVPPKPFALAILGHAHEVKVPDTEALFPGFAEAYYGAAEVKKAA